MEYDEKKIEIADNRTEYMSDQSTVEYSILWVSYVIVLWIITRTSTNVSRNILLSDWIITKTSGIRREHAFIDFIERMNFFFSHSIVNNV